MGQHTWTYKNKEGFEKLKKLENKLNNSIDGSDEYLQIYEEIDLLGDELETQFHNMFRTNKRNQDNFYLFSKKECDKFIKENKETIYHFDEKKYNEFWEKYPNGVIYFG